MSGFERSNPDFDVNVGNLPYCILPEWASRIHHGGVETVTKSSDAGGYAEMMTAVANELRRRTFTGRSARTDRRSPERSSAHTDSKDR